MLGVVFLTLVTICDYVIVLSTVSSLGSVLLTVEPQSQ
jgi:hypothetical protein